MARSRQTSPEGRFLAARVKDAKRRGFTNREIANAYGINERTVRKIASGESSGRRTFGKLVAPSQQAHVAPGASPSIVRVDLKLGKDAAGNDVIRTVNARLPSVLNARGQRVAATPADVFRIPGLAGMVDAERQRLAQQYGAVIVTTRDAGVVSMRPIALRRKPLRISIAGWSV